MTKKLQNPHEPIPTTEKHGREHSPRERRLDEQGREIVSPLPMEPPVGYQKRESMAEMVRRMVTSEHLRLAAEAAGAETFEESEDFDIGDDYEPHSPWENEFDPPISELTKAGREILAAREAEAAKQPPASPLSSAQPSDKKEISGGAEGGIT